MNKAHRPAAVGDDQGALLSGLDKIERLGHEHIGRDGEGIRRHHLFDGPAEEISAHVPANVAVGYDTGEIALTVDDDRAAEALLALDHEGLCHPRPERHDW